MRFTNHLTWANDQQMIKIFVIKLAYLNLYQFQNQTSQIDHKKEVKIMLLRQSQKKIFVEKKRIENQTN